jgi:hypothetical protein
MPNKESSIYIVKKHINFFYDKIKGLFGMRNIEKFMETLSFTGKTFQGIPNFNSRTPKFDSNYMTRYIKKFNVLNPAVTINKIRNVYYFINSLITGDVDAYFLTPSETTPIVFNETEKYKIGQILLRKFNSGIFKFTNFTYLQDPVYYTNFSGKEIDPFMFTINCDQDVGNIKIYINIAIRNDIKRDTELLVVTDIKLILDITDEDSNYMNELNLDSDLIFFNEKAREENNDYDEDNYFTYPPTQSMKPIKINVKSENRQPKLQDEGNYFTYPPVQSIKPITNFLNEEINVRIKPENRPTISLQQKVEDETNYHYEADSNKYDKLFLNESAEPAQLDVGTYNYSDYADSVKF